MRSCTLIGINIYKPLHLRAFHLASSTTTISNVTSRISAKPNPTHSNTTHPGHNGFHGLAHSVAANHQQHMLNATRCAQRLQCRDTMGEPVEAVVAGVRGCEWVAKKARTVRGCSPFLSCIIYLFFFFFYLIPFLPKRRLISARWWKYSSRIRCNSTQTNSQVT